MYKIIKRFFDCVASLVGLTIALPILLIVGVSLFILNKGKAFFVQPRPGKNEKIFKIVKFKSMNDKKDDNGQLLSNEERITKFGRFIRKTSLDEIPQLFNVLIGDMSIVGPRPLKVEYLPLYSEEQKKRHNIKPGITGWAQINGRNAITHTEKFKLDVWYVNNQSFLLDMKIILATIKKVFIREGVGQAGYNTNLPFDGTN